LICVKYSYVKEYKKITPPFFDATKDENPYAVPNMQPNVWLSNKQYKLPSQGVYGSNINAIHTGRSSSE